MNNMFVSLVIINRNGKHHLQNLLPTIQQQKTQFPWEVLIVDNASSDGSVGWIKSGPPCQDHGVDKISKLEIHGLYVFSSWSCLLKVHLFWCAVAQGLMGPFRIVKLKIGG